MKVALKGPLHWQSLHMTAIFYTVQVQYVRAVPVVTTVTCKVHLCRWYPLCTPYILG